MLIAFHFFGIFIFQLLRNRKRLKMVEPCKICSESESEQELKFDPPVYRQRYGAVYEKLLDERWRTQIKKLVDFGCAEFGLFVFIKRLQLNDIFFVDIQEELLKDNLGRLRPLIVDNIRKKCEKFDVTVFAGSVSDPDYRLHKTDCVTAIELIEHLYPDILDTFSYNIFGYIQPKIVIVTTPNADFNVMFNSKNKFRHYDHKFEWSREQFKDWASNLTKRYTDYTVEISGIGPGPPSSLELGCCSQMAVFIHKKLLDVHYVSPLSAQSCLCLSDSECRGMAVHLKLKCQCLCPLCQPNTSVGICSYFSYSKQIISYEISECRDFNPAYNIYYKLVEKIQYPVEVDDRSEEEKMLDTFRYRINNLYGRPNSRFYNEEKDQCEIPLKDVLYGYEELQLSESELSKALIKFGYNVEDCSLNNSQKCESCVIFKPEMDDYSSTSETASGYDSECTKYQQNDDNLSDWDDTSDSKTQQQSTINKDPKLEAAISVAVPTTETDDEKRQQDSLFDSGYQKSLSLLDDSPQTPLDLEEADVFDDTFTLSGENAKKATSNNKKPVDPNKINELDAFNNIPFMLKPQPEMFKKTLKDNLPGPSNISKRKKKLKKVDSDDSPLADVKSVADTIIENTLNKIEVEEEKEIMQIGVQQRKKDEEEWQRKEEEEGHLEEVDEEEDRREEEVILVENGDLANNNRDLEGNNYVAEEIDEGVDFINDNLEIEEAAALPIHNNVIFENNNAENVIVEEEAFIVEERNVLNEAGPLNDGDNTEPPEEISFASREVLFDPNSEEDLLEEFELPPAIHEAEMLQNQDPIFFSIIESTDAAVEANGFPNWLLQILGTQIINEGGEENPTTHDEPHFYCQGDGLGVHPSVIAVEIDQDEADDETTTSTSNNADYAEVDQEPSYQEVSSLPEESQSEVRDGNLEENEVRESEGSRGNERVRDGMQQ